MMNLSVPNMIFFCQLRRQQSLLTPWFPPRHGGAFSTLNLDCESSRRDRDKRLKSKSRAYDFTSPPVHATFQILKTYS